MPEEIPESSSALSAEERRERRRAKILAASDQRLARILSGPDGGEKRMAPAMEGGEFRSSACSLLDSTTDENGGVASLNAPVFGNNDSVKFPSMAELGVTYDPPRLFTFVKTARCKVVSLIALFFFVLSYFNVISSVLLPWSILFLSYSIVERKKSVSPYPSHGYFVNGLMWAGISEDVTINLGFLFESVTNYLTDTCTLLFVFMCLSSARDMTLLLTA
ncbi:hypothetical protein PFISCL1PPCAC_15401 [Pristionchus fissidentatus]|uniref:G protein-coupled receptor n=1 Tax=Pristionchus fissidentatus TaxID=1538716 RepID=A0AAV5W0A4_9BILA|nr:hypothetical protein PFISCL1PPCAC_15401 [Pristionchus fissidentatus]